MNLLQYFSDAREELSRVSWPSREEVIEGAQAVLIFVIALTLLIWVMDMAFGWSIQQALK